MNYKSIAEIYESNDVMREKLKALIGNLTEEQASIVSDGEKWSLAQLIEHIAIVETGMIGICSRLLSKAQAEDKKSDGSAKISEDFLIKANESVKRKLEAPERVRPTGTKTIAESMTKMAENREKLKTMRSMFETFDATAHKFPHPAFGDLTAHEWLVLIGGHEARHLKQIKNLLAKLN
jgi:hypothetical protein